MEVSENVEKDAKKQSDLIARLKTFSVPELCDGAGFYHSMDYRIKPWIGQPGIGQPGIGQPGIGQPGIGQSGIGQPGIGRPGIGQPGIGRSKIVGPAVTVEVPAGEGGIVADAINYLRPGDVLVIAGKGSCDSSYWGDHRSLCASMLKAEGVVIDGAFRDLEGCEEVGFPIFAKGLTCGTAAKSGAGAINVTVSCGGVTVRPGDLIAGDVNGVCVFLAEEAEGIMERALAKRQAQEQVVEEMRRTGRILTRIKNK